MTDEREDDVTELRGILVHSEDVPLGMTSRLEVGVIRAARRRAAALPWEARVLAGCLLFISLGSGPNGGLTPATAVVLAVAALFYGFTAGLSSEDADAVPDA